MTQLTINGKTHDVDADPGTPLLWVLREWVGMTGTKYGCGIAQCGACTVHLDGVATRSCVTPLSLAAGKQISTIEGLAKRLAGLERRIDSLAKVRNVPTRDEVADLRKRVADLADRLLAERDESG